jgi:hemerythrin-like domain-containing protein
MDALGLIRQDHGKLEGLIERLEQGGDDPEERSVLVGQVRRAIRHHTDLEEGLLYPAVRERAAGRGLDLGMLDQALEQHRLIGQLVDELAGVDPDDGDFAAKAKVLGEQVHNHLDAEEARLLAVAEDLFEDEELLDLGRRIEERKRVLVAQQELARSMAPARGPATRLLVLAGAAAALVAAVASRRRPRPRRARHARRRRRSPWTRFRGARARR